MSDKIDEHLIHKCQSLERFLTGSYEVPKGSALHMFQINLNFPKSDMEAKRMWKKVVVVALLGKAGCVESHWYRKSQKRPKLN